MDLCIGPAPPAATGQTEILYVAVPLTCLIQFTFGAILGEVPSVLLGVTPAPFSDVPAPRLPPVTFSMRFYLAYSVWPGNLKKIDFVPDLASYRAGFSKRSRGRPSRSCVIPPHRGRAGCRAGSRTDGRAAALQSACRRLCPYFVKPRRAGVNFRFKAAPVGASPGGSPAKSAPAGTIAPKTGRGRAPRLEKSGTPLTGWAGHDIPIWHSAIAANADAGRDLPG